MEFDCERGEKISYTHIEERVELFNFPPTYFDVKWTLKEYEEELKKPIDQPSISNPEDPLYYRKCAHNVPPPDAHYILLDKKDQVANNDKSKNDRRVYYGWNNITQYEKMGMMALQQYMY